MVNERCELKESWNTSCCLANEASPGDRDLVTLLGTVNDGSFFERSPDEQRSILEYYHHAYLGRGDLITGLVGGGRVGKSFAYEMDIAMLWHLLTLDLPGSQKAAMRNGLSRMQCPLPR